MSVNIVNSQDNEMYERKDVKNSNCKNVFVWFTQTLIGNSILRLVDRALWVAQKCAEWSLPEHMIDTPSNRPLVEGKEYFSLVRPLPWIFFFPSLIFIRSFKMMLNLYLLIWGCPRITELEIVNFIRYNRQHVTKYVKYRRGTANKIEEPSNKDKRLPMNEVKQSLIKSIRLTLSSLSCLDTSKLSVSPPPTKIHVSSVFDFKPIVEESPEKPDSSESSDPSDYSDYSDSNSIHDEAAIPTNAAKSSDPDSIHDEAAIPTNAADSSESSDSHSIHDEAAIPTNSEESIEKSSETVLDNKDEQDSNKSSGKENKYLIDQSYNDNYKYQSNSYITDSGYSLQKFRPYDGCWTERWFQGNMSDSDSDSDNHYALGLFTSVRRKSPSRICTYKKTHQFPNFLMETNQYFSSNYARVDTSNVSNKDTSDKESNKEDMGGEDMKEDLGGEDMKEDLGGEDMKEDLRGEDMKEDLGDALINIFEQDFDYCLTHVSRQDSEDNSEKNSEQTVSEQVTEQASKEEVYEQDFEHSSEHASGSQDSENASKKDCEQSVSKQVTEQAFEEETYERDFGHFSKHASEEEQDTEDATEKICKRLLSELTIEQALTKISEEDKFRKLSKDWFDKTEIKRQHFNSTEKSNHEDDVTFYSPINSDSDLPKDYLMSPSIFEKSVTRDNLETSKFINAEINCSTSKLASKIPESKSSDKINNSVVVEKRSGNVSKWHKGKRSGHSNRKRK